MSGIALTTPLTHPADPSCDIQFVGINYAQGQVVVRIAYTPSGQIRDYIFGQQGIESIAGLVAAVPQFAGLRAALLTHLQTLDANLSGTVN